MQTSTSGTTPRSSFYIHHWNFLFIWLANSWRHNSKYKEKAPNTVDKGILGKLRSYFNGSSLKKVFPPSNLWLILFLLTFSSPVFLPVWRH